MPIDPNSPGNPNSYFNQERMRALTEIAEELLQHQDQKSLQLIREKLKKHHLKITYADTNENIIEFGYYYPRTWNYYIFSKSELPESYSTKPVIMDNNIHYWGELVSIIKTENDLSKYNRESTSFKTEIVYPFLVANLEKELVDKLSGLPPKEDIDSFMSKNKDLPIMEAIDKRHWDYEKIIVNKLEQKEKLKIIEVLNRHCSIQSDLIENEYITWKATGWGPGEKSLTFCGYSSLSSSFQVNKHIQQLLSDSIISIKDRAGHFKVKPDLNEKEKLEIEWLQLEIMRFIYGNLVRKRTFWSDGKLRLAENWYFYKE